MACGKILPQAIWRPRNLTTGSLGTREGPVVRLQILPHGSETLLWACFPTPLPSQTWRKRFFPPPKWQVVRFPAHPGFGTRFETGQRRKACPQQCFSKHVVRLKSYHKPFGGLEILPQARWARPSGHYEYFMHNAPQRGGREGEGGLLPQDYKHATQTVLEVP